MWSMITRRFILLTLLPTATLREQLIFVYVVECVIDLWLWRLHNIIVYAFLLVATFTHTRSAHKEFEKARREEERNMEGPRGSDCLHLIGTKVIRRHVHSLSMYMRQTDPRNRTVAAGISVVTY